MMRLLCWISIAMLALSISGCTFNKKEDLKSPCVASQTDGVQHPCGPRRPVNTHWLG